MDRLLRILQVHNKYRPGWGGEDTVADLEADLLRRNGHEVERLSVWTGELEGANALKLIAAGFGTVWSFRGYALTRKAIASFSPDVLHVHNTFPLLSPSVYWAAHRAGVPVVQTLHNYRLTCANTLLLRNNKPCEECVGHFPWPGLRYRCFGSSFFRTAAVTSKNVVHRWLGTFRTKIHAYVALTNFSKEVFVRAGLPRERIFVKPNFNVDSGKLVALRLPRVVFAGAIARPKGIHLLLETWAKLSPAGHQLVMVGDGPDRAELERRYAEDRNIVWYGTLPRDKVIELIAASQWLVLPSLAYENFPMSVLEAFSVGTPAIVPNHGAFAAMVSNRQEGLVFSAGSSDSLFEALGMALNVTESEWTQWSSNARNRFLLEYTERTNYEQLMSIYEGAVECFQIARRDVRQPRSSKPAGQVVDVPGRDS